MGPPGPGPNRAQHMNGPSRARGPTNEWAKWGPRPNRAQHMNWPRAQAQQSPTNDPLEWAEQGPTNEWAQQGPGPTGPNESPRMAPTGPGPNRAQDITGPKRGPGPRGPNEKTISYCNLVPYYTNPYTNSILLYIYIYSE